MAELFTIKGCPIFSVGTWNGDEYAEADLDRMVAAFGQVGFDPPIKLGHDDSQPLAKSDGMPAIGWVTNLRRSGNQLYCDLKDLPRKVYDAIRRKNYKRVSAEIYWDYACDGKRWPRVLKALALLGADVPAVTNLASLEALYDGEGHTFKRYDMGMISMPIDPCPSMTISMGKSKFSVNYREAESGGIERCGACRYLQGSSPDPTGEQAFIGNCNLVTGEIATSWVCDLWDAREAFSSVTQKDFIIKQRGDKWVLLTKDSGEILGEHDTENEAKAQEQAIQVSKASAKENTQADGVPGPDRKAKEAVETKMNDAMVRRGKTYMEIQEIEGQFCVMKDGEKMKCFETKEEADAYQTSMMAERVAEVKALQMKLEGSERINKDLAAKVTSLEQTTKNLSERYAAIEQRATVAEGELGVAKEVGRKAANETWIKEQTSEANLKILPVERPYVEFMLDMLTANVGTTKTYADNGAELSPVQVFKKIYEQRKAGVVLFKEMSTGIATETARQGGGAHTYGSIAEARQAATILAKAYMEEKKEKRFDVAFKAVLNADPELKNAVGGATPEGQRKAQDGGSTLQRFFKP